MNINGVNIDVVALSFYSKSLEEGDNISATCDLLNVLESCNKLVNKLSNQHNKDL